MNVGVHFLWTMNSLEIDLVYGIIGVFLFIYKNPDKRFLYLISFFVIGLFTSQLVYIYVDIFPGQVIWIISASGLLISYAIRLTYRRERDFFDLLKTVGVLLLIIYPLPFYSLVGVGDGVFWTVVRLSTFSIVLTVYLYDRWILKPEKMKRKFLIVLVGQSVLILLMLMYSFVQHAEAVKQREIAEEQSREADKMRQQMLNIEIKYQELVKENAR